MGAVFGVWGVGFCSFPCLRMLCHIPVAHTSMSKPSIVPPMACTSCCHNLRRGDRHLSCVPWPCSLLHACHAQPTKDAALQLYANKSAGLSTTCRRRNAHRQGAAGSAAAAAPPPLPLCAYHDMLPSAVARWITRPTPTVGHAGRPLGRVQAQQVQGKQAGGGGRVGGNRGGLQATSTND